MCVDFTDLNKACPKDCFPLPRIDRLVDSTVGFDVLYFLDAFKGYHQIEMAEEDREKTSFITEEGTYCYRTMPFGLKNAGATYQRLVNKLFQDQIDKSMEVYVDDMIVKSRTGRQLVPDLRGILNILRENRMRLNPKKSEHDIGYQPRTAIKAQALADFLAEGASLSVTEPSSLTKEARPEEPWVLFVDGASSKEGSGAGLLLTSPTGEELIYALRFDFPASNNEAEYETLLTGLRIAHQMGITTIRVRSDSQLVVYQVRGEYEAKEEVMKKYLAKVQEAIKLFDLFEIERVPRSQNKRADALSKLASSSFAHLSKEVLVEVVKQKSIGQIHVLAIDSPATWMTPLVDFLNSGAFPVNKTEARRLQLRAARYAYAGGSLYRRSYLPPG
ncbi:uncharacterized protein [Coffea arabica]|uniref:RNase H type-1 domain-containing protein n=1 Tax=Coffea arabica TaxID=13443 RepID=A0ABM4W0V3_COFAR